MILLKSLAAIFGLVTSSQAQDTSKPLFESQSLIPLQKAIEYSQKECVTPSEIYLHYECQMNRTPVVPMHLQLTTGEAPLWGELPSEVSSYILSFVPDEQLLTLSTVHSSWHTYFLNGFKNQCLVLNDATITTVPIKFLEYTGGLFFNLSTPNIQAMSNLLAQSKNLKYLGIRFNSIKDNHFNAYSEKSSDELKGFFEEINKLNSLKYLDLYKTHLRIFDFKPHAWPFVKQLQLFNGGYNKIALKGTTYTFLLKAFTDIQVMSLQGVSCLESANLDFLLSVSSLKFVNLNGTKVKVDFIKKLRGKNINVFFEPYQVNAAAQQNTLAGLTDLLANIDLGNNT